MWERLAEKYGWRGLYLQLFGAMWVLIGVSSIATPPVPLRSWVLYQYAPGWLNGIGWLVTGLVAIVVGHRGPVDDDSAGHGALYIMPALRSASFLVSWFVWLVTSLVHHCNEAVPVAGFEQAVFGAVTYMVFVATVALHSRWPNTRHLIPKPPIGTSARSEGQEDR